ncbi:cytochrome p450 [Lentinula edodes]|uniref:Cytochrome p450 n=1 Tax=Lentinula edodes TaxID=5353 RepID=A0A1Q3EB92_LENED|nr:cytochrome p450 [Lentinula edodes]
MTSHTVQGGSTSLESIRIIDHLFGILEEYGQGDYIGEPAQTMQLTIVVLDQQYWLLSFMIAVKYFPNISSMLKSTPLRFCSTPSSPEIGTNMLLPSGESVGKHGHDIIGGLYLASLGFPPEVWELVRDHVVAKRYLTAVEEGYHHALSEASKLSLGFQGGPFSHSEIKNFEQDPLFFEKVQMRRFDDAAKIVGKHQEGWYINITRFYMELFVLLCITLVLILLGMGLNSRRWVNKKLPPGPRGLPILGNIFQLGTGSVWLAFDELKSRYGPIVYLNMAGQNTIVLNHKAAAIELLERRSAIYSDRPRFIVAEYLGSQSVMPFTRYGKLWKAMRRAGHRVLHARASTKYQPVQIQESIILTHDLLCNTSSPLLTKIHNSASTMCHQLIARHNHNFLHLIAAYPGAHLVEAVPILDYLPSAMAKWKREAQRDSQHITAVVEQYYNDAVRNDLQQATLCAGLATDQVATGLSDIENAWVAATLAAGALETTSISLSFFLYAMSQHQNVQQQAQIELDRVVGQSRTPNFVDMAQLPYVRAIVKEVLRWQPAVPLAVPHVVMEDDWYEGYFIPKGTTIIPNVNEPR